MLTGRTFSWLCVYDRTEVKYGQICTVDIFRSLKILLHKLVFPGSMLLSPARRDNTVKHSSLLNKCLFFSPEDRNSTFSVEPAVQRLWIASL